MASDKNRIGRAKSFVSDGIWDIDPGSLNGARWFGVSFLRVVHLVWRGFKRNECPLHASSLTFATLMSIVPVLAICLSVAKGFGADDVLEAKVRASVGDWLHTLEQSADPLGGADSEGALSNAVLSVSNTVVAASSNTVVSATNTPALVAASTSNVLESAEASVSNAVVAASTSDVETDEPAGLALGFKTDANDPTSERVDELIVQVFDFAENADFAKLGGIGLLVLLFTVVNVLGQVENSFNRVWGVTQRRSIFRQFTDYVSMLLILPLLILASSGLPLVQLLNKVLPSGMAVWAMALLNAPLLKNLTMLVLLTIAFGVFLKLMPNTRVRWRAALIGGGFAALLFVLAIAVCVYLQVGAARQNALFGSFAIVLIVLFWAYISWAIILLGAEVAFAVQNCATFRMEETAGQASVESRVLLALSVVAEMSAQLSRDDKGAIFDAVEYAGEKNIPVRLLNSVLRELADAGFVAEITEDFGKFAFIRAPDRVFMKDVVDVIMKSGTSPQSLGLHKLNERIMHALETGELSGGGDFSSSSIRELSSTPAA